MSTLAAFPAATVEVVDAEVVLSYDEARALTRRIKGVTSELVCLVQKAYTGRAWAVLGYPSWQAYLEDAVGSALRGLPVEQRQQVTGVLADSGMSRRAIGAVTGRSDERVRADLRLVRPDGTGPTTGVDGKTYAGVGGTPAAAGAAPAARPATIKTRTALELLEAAGPDGLTIPELMRRKRWSYGQASATLSRLNRQADTLDGVTVRRVERVAAWRGGYATYVLPAHVGQRETLAPGTRRNPA